MFCTKCGVQIKEGSAICANCGTRADASENSIPDIRTKKAVKKSSQEKSKNSTGLIIGCLVAGILLLAALCIVALLFVFKLRKTGPDTTQRPANKVTQEKTEDTQYEEPDDIEGPDGIGQPYEADENTEENVYAGTEENAGAIPTYNIRPARISGITASSTCKATSVDGQTYEAEHLLDGDYTTAWLEGKSDSGIGEYVTIYFDGYEKIDKIVIYNGFLNTKYRYAINGKVARVQLDFNDGTSFVEDLKIMDVPDIKEPFDYTELNPTEICFDNPIGATSVKITILDAIDGLKYSDTCMSEIEIYAVE